MLTLAAMGPPCLIPLRGTSGEAENNSGAGWAAMLLGPLGSPSVDPLPG